MSSEIPYGWLESTFIHLLKKQNTEHCRDFRLIRLMSHNLKVLLKIINNRILVPAQKCFNQQKDIYIYIIDFEKAFDMIKHDALMKALEDTGVDNRDLTVKNLYWQQKAWIRIGSSVSNNTEVRLGVRQGSVLSPILFNLNSEVVFEDKTSDRLKINRYQIRR